jgi:hypothetical protein
MTTAIEKTATTDLALDELANEINAEHAKAEAAARSAVDHALRAGELLIEAKGQCQHGEWGAWIQEHCEFSERTAQVYMRVARELPKLDDPKAQRVADLPLRDVSRLLATDRRDYLCELADVEPTERRTSRDYLWEAVVTEVELLCKLGTIFGLLDQAGSWDEVDRIMREHRAEEVFAAMATPGAKDARPLAELCRLDELPGSWEDFACEIAFVPEERWHRCIEKSIEKRDRWTKCPVPLNHRAMMRFARRNGSLKIYEGN